METGTEEIIEDISSPGLIQPDIEELRAEYEKITEAVLFTVRGTVGASEIARACGCDRKTAANVLKGLKERYEEEDGALLIREIDGSYQMCTSPRYFEHLTRVVSAPKKPALSDALMETLSIIACKNPATRNDIERIRGVKSDFSVNRLLEYGLIEEAGRLDMPGKPVLFKPTEEFYRRFGVETKQDLPVVGPEMESRIEDEVDTEVRKTFDNPVEVET